MSCGRFNVLFALIVVLMLSLSASAQSIWYVDENSPAGSTGDGTEWDEAFDDPQGALQKDPPPEEDDQIWVAEGTYATNQGGTVPPNPTDSTFTLLNRVSVYGGFVAGDDDLEDRDPVANETILTGVLASPHSGRAKHVVTADSTVTNLTVLDGFTITGGLASSFAGAGIFCGGGYPVIRACTIEGNDGLNSPPGGGGIFCFNSANGTSDFVEIRDCLIQDNCAGYGGGIAVQAEFGASRVAIINCRVRDNEADGSNGRGAGIYIDVPGSGFSDDEAVVKIISCRIEGNFVTGNGTIGGAGLAVLAEPTSDGADVQIVNTVIFGNTANVPDQTNLGGGVWNDGGDIEADGLTLTENTALSNGGGWYEAKDPTLVNASVIQNAIIWENTAATGPDIFNAGILTVEESIVNPSNIAGAGVTLLDTINQDPLFVSGPAGGCASSPPHPRLMRAISR